jgi:hypothetical protein
MRIAPKPMNWRASHSVSPAHSGEMANRAQDRCFWCGADNPGERDHVFPESLFLEPRPSLITVPACGLHNRVFSLDEEYFREFVLASSYSHPEARVLWQTKTRSALRRKPSYRAMLAAQLRRLEMRTAGGIYLGVLDALIADAVRINNVVRKIVRGLYYHHYKEPLGPADWTIDQVRADRPLPPAAVALVRGMPQAIDVGHVRYRFARAPDEPGAVAGAVRFFGRVFFVLIGVPSERDDRLDLPTRTRRGRLWLPPEAS